MPDKSVSQRLSETRGDLEAFLDELKNGREAGIPLAQMVRSKIEKVCKDLEKIEVQVEMAHNAVTAALRVLRGEEK
jgi:hypothetical protein